MFLVSSAEVGALQSDGKPDKKDVAKMKATIKDTYDFFTGLAKDIGHLNSSDRNGQWAASFRVAARAAKLIGGLTFPPLGKALSKVLTLASMIRPFPTEQGVSFCQHY